MRIRGDMPKTVASLRVMTFGVSSSSASAWTLVRPYSEIGSSGVCSSQIVCGLLVPYPLLVVGNTTSWLGDRNRLIRRIASRFTAVARAGSRSQAGAPTIAASGTIASARATSGRMRFSSVTSPKTKSKRGLPQR